jgi:hypothetical protein
MRMRLASVWLSVCLLDWKIDIQKIMSCVFSSGEQKSTVDRIRMDLLSQHVTRYIPDDENSDDGTWNEEHEMPNSLGDTIDERTSIVQKLLPIFDFDYRLAVFLARPTQSHKAFKAKLQLASIMTVGIDRLFNFTHRGTMTHEEYRDSLVEACRGWSFSLAHTGSMWLAVGLWKHGTMVVDDHDTNTIDTSKVKIPGTVVTMNLDAFRSVQQILTSLTKFFISSYIAVLPDSLIEAEMSDSECEEIQEHLGWAYLHQIVETKKLPDGTIAHQLCKGPEEDYSITLPPWTFDEADFDNLLEEDISYYDDGSHYDRIFGIFHGMSREFGMSNLYLDDWTYVTSTRTQCRFVNTTKLLFIESHICFLSFMLCFFLILPSPQHPIEHASIALREGKLSLNSLPVLGIWVDRQSFAVFGTNPIQTSLIMQQTVVQGFCELNRPGKAAGRTLTVGDSGSNYIHPLLRRLKRGHVGAHLDDFKLHG